MSNKIGKWARFDCNSIKQLNDYIDLEDAIESDAKIKDTPRELLQKNDLVIIDNYWEEPLFVDHIDFFNSPRVIVRTSSGSETINLSNKTVTKIFTPDSNGNFIKQWEAE